MALCMFLIPMSAVEAIESVPSVCVTRKSVHLYQATYMYICTRTPKDHFKYMAYCQREMLAYRCISKYEGFAHP